MLYFKNDYQEGCAKEILEALTKTNLEATIGYGFDQYSQKAEAKIKALLDIDCDIHFLIGGTQTNLCAISVLRPYEAVISCNTGHINIHEAGAIELTGHKVITTNNINGKIDFIDLEKKINEHSDIHMVIPKMVYISNSTELGTIYTKKDLEQLPFDLRKYYVVEFYDTHIKKTKLSVNERKVELNKIWKQFESSEWIITDRLHGMIFAFITRTPAIVIPNNNHKIGSCYEWIRNCGYIFFVPDPSINIILDTVISRLSYGYFFI